MLILVRLGLVLFFNNIGYSIFLLILSLLFLLMLMLMTLLICAKTNILLNLLQNYSANTSIANATNVNFASAKATNANASSAKTTAENFCSC